MALNIKNDEVERLVTEVAHLAHETKTEAVRRALEERKQRLAYRSTGDRATTTRRFLERDVWPLVPDDQRGKRLTSKEEDDILGYGEHGV